MYWPLSYSFRSADYVYLFVLEWIHEHSRAQILPTYWYTCLIRCLCLPVFPAILVHVLDQLIMFISLSRHIGIPAWSADDVYQFVPPYWYPCLIKWSSLPVCPWVKPCTQSRTNYPHNISTLAWSAYHFYLYVSVWSAAHSNSQTLPPYWYTFLISCSCFPVCPAILVHMLDQLIMFTCLSWSEAMRAVAHKPSHHIGTRAITAQPRALTLVPNHGKFIPMGYNYNCNLFYNLMFILQIVPKQT